MLNHYHGLKFNDNALRLLKVVLQGRPHQFFINDRWPCLQNNGWLRSVLVAALVIFALIGSYIIYRFRPAKSVAPGPGCSEPD